MVDPALNRFHPSHNTQLVIQTENGWVVYAAMDLTNLYHDYYLPGYEVLLKVNHYYTIIIDRYPPM